VLQVSYLALAGACSHSKYGCLTGSSSNCTASKWVLQATFSDRSVRSKCDEVVSSLANDGNRQPQQTNYLEIEQQHIKETVCQ
jgi:hypothetical protein